MEPAIDIGEDLVAGMIADQFPHWAGLPVRAAPQQGWDNRTFRIGEELTVRLPSAAAYELGVRKEKDTLDFLRGRLPVATPVVVALGKPGRGYPFQWSVRQWLEGTTLDRGVVSDQVRFASDLGAALRILRSLPTDAGLAAGQHSFYRGCHPSVYGDQVQAALKALGADLDVGRCERIWAEATRSAWGREPVWFHGDVAPGNILVEDGNLSALIDFGTCGVGDPACDLTIAWTHFDGEARAAFKAASDLDEGTWQRARGWVLWKALVTITGQSAPDPDGVQQRALRAIMGE